jgi:hypothetical protein
MKIPVRNIFISVFCGWIFGVLGFFWGRGDFNTSAKPESEARVILSALVDQRLAIKENTCQVNMAIENVSDFVSSYVYWSLQVRNLEDVSSFKCSGASVRQCFWSFGGTSFPESWSTTLGFLYDANTKKVDPKSITCMDSP